MRTYIYVDGENHFFRSSTELEEIGGKSASERLVKHSKSVGDTMYGFPQGQSGRFIIERDLQLFWDCGLVYSVLTLQSHQIARAIHVCASGGDDDKLHEVRVRLRQYSFDPVVVNEKKPDRKNRENKITNESIFEKPKRCDIELATRVVADAAANLYDRCVLFTSDADFLPAIEAIRRMGKVVIVLGYESGKGKRSPFQYVPDLWVDLSERLKRAWNEVKSK